MFLYTYKLYGYNAGYLTIMFPPNNLLMIDLTTGLRRHPTAKHHADNAGSSLQVRRLCWLAMIVSIPRAWCLVGPCQKFLGADFAVPETL